MCRLLLPLRHLDMNKTEDYKEKYFVLILNDLCISINLWFSMSVLTRRSMDEPLRRSEAFTDKDSFSLPVSLSPSLYLFLSHTFSISLCLYLSLCLFLSRYLFFLCVRRSVSSVSLCLSPSVSVPVKITYTLSMVLSVYIMSM